VRLPAKPCRTRAVPRRVNAQARLQLASSAGRLPGMRQAVEEGEAGLGRIDEARRRAREEYRLMVFPHMWVG
jgi:hypothetical protein